MKALNCTLVGRNVEGGRTIVFKINFACLPGIRTSR